MGEYIDYGAGSLRANFGNQLKLLSTQSLHISSVGTAQAYAPFMPDGSVHVNLGDRQSMPGAEAPKTNRYVSFLEEVWVEGVPYMRALHYDPKLQRDIAFDKSAALALFKQASEVAQKGFQIP